MTNAPRTITTTNPGEGGTTEAFWRGRFGDDYAKRSPGDRQAVTAMLRKVVLGRPIHSVLELGAGTGNNMRALLDIDQTLELAAVEINDSAAAEIPRGVEIHRTTVAAFDCDRRWDMVMTRGLLIHIPPEDLPLVYAKILRAAGRYVLLAEYYNPTRVEVPYRGHAGRLWKADFAGEMLDAYPSLHLVNYGFAYHRDPLHPQDDVSWFLLERQS